MAGFGRSIWVVAGIALAGPVLAQGYGLRPTSAPRTPRIEPTRSDAPYDRADKVWRGERHDCLYGRKKSRSAAQSCDYVQRTPEPLSSDYLKTPTAK